MPDVSGKLPNSRLPDLLFFALLAIVTLTSASDALASKRLKQKMCASQDEVCAMEKKLHSLNSSLIELSRKKYATYAESDSSYVNDLAQYIANYHASWKKYRDAKCQMEPFIQGMDRRESYAIVEDCRKEETESRIREVQVLITNTKEL